MPYRLERKEAPADSVRRVVHEQLDRAERALKSSDLDRGERVHQARKRFKKIRGLLRLVRDDLGGVYSKENRCYRDIGRKLSPLRDARAVLEAFDALMSHWQGQVDTEAFDPLRAYLDSRRRTAESKGAEFDQIVTEVWGDLAEARSRIDSWPLKQRAVSLLDSDFARTYKRGRRAMTVAYKRPASAAFHQWRKRVKYHRYHVRLHRRLWPPLMRPVRDELKQLSDLLGDDHDLVVLRQRLAAAEFDQQDTQECREALFALLDRRQEQLRTKAHPLGIRLYAEKPKHMLRRMHAYGEALAIETETTL